MSRDHDCLCFALTRSNTRKAMRTASSTSTGSDGSKRAKSAGSSTGTGVMNIQQKVVLSLEQQKVLSLVVAEGKNIFFTGSAGKWSLQTPYGIKR